MGYGGGFLAGGAVWYLGFVHSRYVTADVDTLVGAAEVQVRLASTMRAEARGGLVRQAHEFLDDVEAQRHDYLPARELRAQLFYLEGQYAEAATLYGWLQEHESATPHQRDVFALNRSRMLRAAENPRAAERVLLGHRRAFLPQNEAESQIEMARVLADLGREKEAVDVIVRLAAESEASMVLLTAGLFLERHGRLRMADTTYQKAATKEPLADYYRARLKIRNLEYDSGLDLLERVMRAAGPRVRGLLRRDREAWSPCVGNKRFEDLLESAGKAARPGR